MSKKRKSILFLLTIVALFLASFYVYKQFVEDKPKVTFVLKDLKLQSWQILEAGAEKGFKDFNIDGKVVAPKSGTVEEQRALLEKVLQEKPDLLVVAAISDELIPQLEKFSAEGIPVLLTHTNLPWEGKLAYIGTDNDELGKKVGILMASKMQPNDKVALLGRDNSVDLERVYGAKQSLEEGGLDIVIEKFDLPSDEDGIKRITKEILEEHPNLKGIVTSSDYVALPALQVVREQGFNIPVTGTDGIPDMLQVLKDDILSISVIQNPYDMGYLSAETSFRILNGESIDNVINSGVDVITKNNVAERMEFYRSVLK